MIRLKYKLTLLEEMLGTKPANPEVFGTYVQSLAPPEQDTTDEREAAERMALMAEKGGTTVFHTDAKGRPYIYNYQIKGFMKDACAAMRNADESASKELKAYKTRIDQLIFVNPRIIYLQMPEGAQVGICERPLRAETAQGPRVSLCRSHTVPVGTVLEFELLLLKADLHKYLEEWFQYGSLRGLGQWRNSGKGSFQWEEIVPTPEEKGKK